MVRTGAERATTTSSGAGRPARLLSPLAIRLARDPLPWSVIAPLASTGGLMVADIAALMLAAVAIPQVVLLLDPADASPHMPGISPSALTLPLGIAWLLLRWVKQLYPGHGIAPPEEFRRSAMSSVIMAACGSALRLQLGAPLAAVGAGIVVWLVAIPGTWLFRGIAKTLLVRAGLFGRPVIVIGAGQTGTKVVRELHHNLGLGLVPVGLFDDDPAKHDLEVEGVPVIGTVSSAAWWRAPYPVRDAIIAIPSAGGTRTVEVAQQLAHRYPDVSVVADLVGLGNLWVQPQTLGTVVMLGIPHHRFSTWKRIVKRGFDLAVGLPLFLASVPIVATCALLVKVFSRGPAFYTQQREGANGKPIGVWKIRTMVMDADRALERYLAGNPEARAEWERQMKLRVDPRIIPHVGALLRQTSLDELPQLWNVVRGDMSLVGPRPFPYYHLSRFDDEFRSLRHQVPPGITGFWQITDRSDGDLQVQQGADSYYIHNWSLWLDLWIMLKTAVVVLRRKGAY